MIFDYFFKAKHAKIIFDYFSTGLQLKVATPPIHIRHNIVRLDNSINQMSTDYKSSRSKQAEKSEPKPGWNISYRKPHDMTMVTTHPFCPGTVSEWEGQGSMPISGKRAGQPLSLPRCLLRCANFQFSWHAAFLQLIGSWCWSPWRHLNWASGSTPLTTPSPTLPHSLPNSPLANGDNHFWGGGSSQLCLTRDFTVHCAQRERNHLDISHHFNWNGRKLPNCQIAKLPNCRPKRQEMGILNKLKASAKIFIYNSCSELLI